MKPADFRRIALSLEGAEEGSHMGSPDFRVGGRIFATLASQHQGFGNLMLTPEQQADFVRELPNVFLPVPGGWGKNGATHIRLDQATEDVLTGALHTAWALRRSKNASTKRNAIKSKTPPAATPRVPRNNLRTLLTTNNCFSGAPELREPSFVPFVVKPSLSQRLIEQKRHRNV